MCWALCTVFSRGPPVSSFLKLLFLFTGFSGLPYTHGFFKGRLWNCKSVTFAWLLSAQFSKNVTESVKSGYSYHSSCFIVLKALWAAQTRV